VVPVSRRFSRDRGFTLVELLIGFAVTGIVMSSAVMVFFVLADNIESSPHRIDDMRGLQQVASYLTADITATPPEWMSTDPNLPSACPDYSGNGVNVLDLRWMERRWDLPSRTYWVSYAVEQNSGRAQLVRISCDNRSGLPSPAMVTPMTSLLTPWDPIVNVTVNGGYVTLSLTQPDGQTMTMSATSSSPTVGLDDGDDFDPDPPDDPAGADPPPPVVASDNFDSPAVRANPGSYQGGTGWLTGWTESDNGNAITGDIGVVDGSALTGNLAGSANLPALPAGYSTPNVLFLEEGNTTTRIRTIERQANMTGAGTVEFIYLRDRRWNSGSRTLNVDVWNGSSWLTISTITGNGIDASDTQWSTLTATIPAEARVADGRVRLQSLNSNDRWIFIDDLQIRSLYPTLASDGFDDPPARSNPESYAGGTNWAGPWVEIDNDDAITGDIGVVDGSALTGNLAGPAPFATLPSGYSPPNVVFMEGVRTIERPIDLSTAQSVSLIYTRDAAWNFNRRNLSVQVWNGSGWVTIAAAQGTGANAADTGWQTLSAIIPGAARIPDGRIRVTSVGADNNWIFLDNIAISATG
jgi:prepilin-type N-terminal cleavage/methylation domain-containing protein